MNANNECKTLLNPHLDTQQINLVADEENGFWNTEQKWDGYNLQYSCNKAVTDLILVLITFWRTLSKNTRNRNWLEISWDISLIRIAMSCEN